MRQAAAVHRQEEAAAGGKTLTHVAASPADRDWQRFFGQVKGRVMPWRLKIAPETAVVGTSAVSPTGTLVALAAQPPGYVGERLFDQYTGAPGALDLGAHRGAAKTTPVFVAVPFRKNQKQPFYDGDGLATAGAIEFGGIEILEKALRVFRLRTEPRSGGRCPGFKPQPALHITFDRHGAIFCF